MGKKYGFSQQVTALVNAVVVLDDTENKQEYFEEMSLPLVDFSHQAHGRGGV